MRTKTLLWGLFFIVSSSVAGATDITMEYSGTVTSTDANAVAISEVEVGDSVTGQFIFDSDSQDEIESNQFSGLYEANSLTLTVKSFNYTASDNNLSITNDSVLVAGQPALDAFEIVSGLWDVSGPALSGLPPAQIDLVIVDTEAKVFTDDSLPTSLDIDDFDINSEEPFGTTGGRLIFQSLATGGIGEVRFRIDTINAVVDLPTSLNQTQVSQLYVSIFGRASEGEGNSYWQTLELDMATTADVMLDTDAARNYFGANLNTNQAFIEHIYLNTLNKTIADDFDGINYWVGLLDAGTSRGQAVATLVGAIYDYAPGGPLYDPDDTATIAAYNQFTNRVEVSDYMADNVYATPDDWERSTSFSHGLIVTDDPATLGAAKTNIDLFR
jgi:hypothetical protein